MSRLLYIIFFLFFNFILLSQADHKLYEKYSHILIQNQNDFWKWRKRTDRYFTNSIYIEHFSHKYHERWKNSFLLKVFPKLEYEDSVQNFGFGFGQDFYTPIDISKSEIQNEDRPYAGYLYLSLINVSNSYIQSSRLTAVYQLGLIGPHSFAEEVQKGFHNLKATELPKGWDNQIATDIGFNLNLSYEKRLIQPMEYIDFIGFLDANIFSTVSNNLALGLHYRVGLFNDYFTNITGKKPKKELWEKLTISGCSYYCEAIERDWQFYAFIKSSFYSSLDNSFLEGGVINRSSAHTLHTDDIDRFFFQGEFGLRLSTKGIDLIYSQLFRTAEFVNAKNSYWGKFQFIFSY